MGARTELVGARTELVGARTELVGARTELVGARTELFVTLARTIVKTSPERANLTVFPFIPTPSTISASY